MIMAIYCLSEKEWQSGLSLCCEARGGSILLKFLHNNLALICINFLTISGFFRAAKRKNKAVFRISLKMANLYEIFYIMKVIGKIHLGYFLNGRTVNFHFRLILEFSD
jgi:hypothetical protein